MSWPEVFLVFLVCHLVGDFLIQTEWQARNKPGGLGREPEARRALISHLSAYTLCFLPALIWIGNEIGVLEAVGIGAVIAIPHLVIDDGRLLGAWMRAVKHVPEPLPAGLLAAVDQSFHLICLWATALLVIA